MDLQLRAYQSEIISKVYQSMMTGQLMLITYYGIINSGIAIATRTEVSLTSFPLFI